MTAPAPRTPGVDEAWIGLGANLGDREDALQRALDAFPELEVVGPVVETEPWGIREQPWFLNTVARLRWRSGARALLARCLRVEESLGRVRAERNGPRTIDLDVLVCGPGRLDEPGLTVPHGGIAARRSVLEPWAPVAGGLLVPGLPATIEVLRDRLAADPAQGVRPWSPREPADAGPPVQSHDADRWRKRWPASR